MSDKESAATYFSHHCNKLVNGNCRTTNCLHRGGYISGGETDPHWDDATCEALEAVNAFIEIDQLKVENNAQRAEIAALEAEIERLRTYVGSQMLRSDFQTADEMRVEINRLRAEGDRYRWLLSQPI